MKKIFLLIITVNFVLALDKNSTKHTVSNDNDTAITISKDSVDDVLNKYDKTLVLLKDTEESISQYHETLKNSIDSFKETYNDISPDISKKSDIIVSSIKDMNSTVKLSMDSIEKNIDDYYVIEIIAFIAFLISINNILEIIIKLRRFRFIRRWLKKIKDKYGMKHDSKI